MDINKTNEIDYCIARHFDVSVEHVRYISTSDSIVRLSNIGIPVSGFTEEVKELEKSGCEDAFKEVFYKRALGIINKRCEV